MLSSLSTPSWTTLAASSGPHCCVCHACNDGRGGAVRHLCPPTYLLGARRRTRRLLDRRGPSDSRQLSTSSIPSPLPSMSAGIPSTACIAPPYIFTVVVDAPPGEPESPLADTTGACDVEGAGAGRESALCTTLCSTFVTTSGPPARHPRQRRQLCTPPVSTVV
ncbi:hypothetical protein BD626DRAFT_516738, partial [Schizophyllum amplum]